MSLSILVYAVFTGFGYFVSSAWQLAALRFIASLGMGGEWALGVALVMEAWPSDKRPLLAGFIGAASNVGFLLIALVGLTFVVSESQWRWIMLAGAAPGLLTFFIQSHVPESQKWKQAAAAGGNDPLKEVFGPKLVRNTAVAVGLGGIALLGTWGSVQWIPGWVQNDLLKSATQVEKSNAAAWAQIASAIGAILGCFAGALLGGRLGRRPVYFGLCLISLVLCQYLFRSYDAYSNRLLVLVGLIGFTTAAFYGWLPLYLPELFPTRVRATGQGIAFNLGRVIAAAGVLGGGWIVKANNDSWAAAGAVVSMVYALGMILIWFAPETRGKPLPE
jgi:MFS family permease